MLNFIRKSTIGIILAFVFMLSLFFFKSSGRFSGIVGVGANDVAVVGEEKISNIQFIRSFDLIKNQFGQMVQKKLTNKEAVNIGLDKQTLNILLDQAIFKNEYKKQKLFLDDTVIANQTSKVVPSIYDKNNKIIDTELNNFLYNQNLTLNDFIDLITFELINKEYEDNLIKNIYYPYSILEIINIYENHKRNIEYLILPLDNLNLQIDNNNKLLKEFYENNKSIFMQPEKRKIEYISLNKVDFLKDFYINESEIFKYYEDNIDSFTESEKRSFLQINFNDENNANDFLLEIKNLKYNEILKKVKNKNISFNENKFISFNNTLEEIAKVVFTQNINEVSDVITSSLAYHITIIKDIKQNKAKTLNESKESIINVLRENYYYDYVENLIEKIDEDLLNNYSIGDISNKYNLKLNKISNIQKNDNKNNEIKDIIDESFKLKIGIPSDIIKNEKNNSYFVTNVSEIIEPKISEFENIRNSVKRKYEYKQIQIQIQKIINDNSKISLEETGNKYGINIIKKTISKNQEDLPKDLINKFFNGKINERVSFFDSEHIYLGLAKSINIVEQNNNNNNLNIDNDIYVEIKNSILNEISKEYSIKINNNLINTLVNNN